VFREVSPIFKKENYKLQMRAE